MKSYKWHAFICITCSTYLFILLVVLGIILFPQYFKITDLTKITRNINAESLANIEHIDSPVLVKFPSIDLEVPVQIGGIIEGQWVLEDDSALFANLSVSPAAMYGNTIVYGHNTQPVFLNTKKLRFHDQVQLVTESGQQYEYEYISYEIVSADDLSVFDYNGPNQLAIITCNGWRSQNRKIMYFRKLT